MVKDSAKNDEPRPRGLVPKAPLFSTGASWTSQGLPTCTRTPPTVLGQSLGKYDWWHLSIGGIGSSMSPVHSLRIKPLPNLAEEGEVTSRNLDDKV